MVYDGENTFYWKKALNGTTTGTSDVVQTGKGDAGNPLILYVTAPGATADLTVELQTAVDEAFTKAVTLGTYTLKKDDGLKTKVPYGDLGFMLIKYTGASALTGGTLTAALVMDADLA